jgi:hypothetical protein
LFPYVPGGSSKRLEEERSSKVASSSGNHLSEIKIVLQSDVYRLPTSFTEATIPEKVISSFQQVIVAEETDAVVIEGKVFPYAFAFRRSLASSQKKDLIFGVHLDSQIEEEKMGASM